MNSFELGEFKLTLIRKMIEDENIVALINAPTDEVEYPDDLIYTRIFPYNRVPDTEQEVKTYITVMVNATSVPMRNDITRKISIIVRIYSHCNLMKVTGESSDRIDLLSGYVDRLMNESLDFGIGYVTLGSNTEHVLDSTHFFRELVFYTDALNSRRDGARQWN